MKVTVHRIEGIRITRELSPFKIKFRKTGQITKLLTILLKKIMKLS